MNLKKYFESEKGVGFISTLDNKGMVDVAV